MNLYFIEPVTIKVFYFCLIRLNSDGAISTRPEKYQVSHLGRPQQQQRTHANKLQCQNNVDDAYLQTNLLKKVSFDKFWEF